MNPKIVGLVKTINVSAAGPTSVKTEYDFKIGISNE